MDKGRIVERGTHEQLLANRGFYHHIWCLQYNVDPNAPIGDAGQAAFSMQTAFSTGGTH
jgi:hypothetical protein